MRITILQIVAFTLLPACWADDIKPFDLKAGLWERTVTTEAQYSAETLAKMPPAERARIDAMMKDRLGVPATAKVCQLRASLDKGFSFPGRDCTTKLVSYSPSRQEIHVDCQNRMSADAVMDRADSGHVKATLTMRPGPDDPSAGEGPTDIKMTISDKWLSPDCGDVKPTGAK